MKIKTIIAVGSVLVLSTAWVEAQCGGGGSCGTGEPKKVQQKKNLKQQKQQQVQKQDQSGDCTAPVSK